MRLNEQNAKKLNTEAEEEEQNIQLDYRAVGVIIDLLGDINGCKVNN
jgi:hypothetical protein